jgi:hypothetical protein
MPDTPAKREREAKKRRHREIKAERKRLRKEGLLGTAPPGPTFQDVRAPESTK